MRRIARISLVAFLTIAFGGCASLPSTHATSEPTPSAIDAAIITVLPEEYHAVVGKIENVRPVIEPNGEPNVYVWVTGEIPSASGTRRVVVAMAGEAGEVSGALVTQSTIDRWKPRHVLLVGIAGGLDESIRLGDVVISSQIWGYEHGHLGTEYDTGGVYFFQSDGLLLDAALEVGQRWQRHVSQSPPGPGIRSQVVIGKTASGNKVIENTRSTYFAQTLRLNESIVSVEMEGAGAGAAIERDHDTGGTTGFLMIRGISDLVKDTNDTHEARHGSGRNPERALWKHYAADVAASFAVALIQLEWPD
jgi:nucleoside phosphorylase